MFPGVDHPLIHEPVIDSSIVGSSNVESFTVFNTGAELWLRYRANWTSAQRTGATVNPNLL
jgi:hypothetical protein